jgi:hypothetical protein
MLKHREQQGMQEEEEDTEGVRTTYRQAPFAADARGLNDEDGEDGDDADDSACLQMSV